MSIVQVVAAALDAARHRRDRAQQLAGMATPGDRTCSKRKTVPRTDPMTGSTTASSTEKVTPDPKHIRTGDEIGIPEPKALFVSPSGPGEAAGDLVGEDADETGRQPQRCRNHKLCRKKHDLVPRNWGSDMSTSLYGRSSQAQP